MYPVLISFIVRFLAMAETNNFLPLMLDLSGRKIVIFGGAQLVNAKPNFFQAVQIPLLLVLNSLSGCRSLRLQGK